ncbi:MAG: protein kinase [Myxococcales bacterium]|nr:protein kinase [Myxococcales bacterium]
MGPGSKDPAMGRGRTLLRGDPISFAEVNARATMGLYEQHEDDTFDPKDWIDREIAKTYRIVELLGEGGMGAVFVAEHLRLRKQVAVKIIRPEIVDDEQIALRFRREALATARLEHPHVASAFDYDAFPEGGAYLVMQLVRGQSLRELLNLQGRFEWQQACEIAGQIADALSAAHAEGIVHRDLKPDNILLETRANGQYFVKVLDFGIARIVPEQAGREARGGTEQQALTRVGMVVGTPGYMSPEQAMGETVDARADLYSLGVILWEMIAGRPLWKASTLGEMFAKQFKENPPRLRDVLGGPVPGPLESITAELLERAPEDRKITATDLHGALKKLSMGLDPDAEVTGAYTSLAAEQESRTRANKVLQPPTAEHEAWYNRSLQSLSETFEDLENRHGRGRVLIGVAVIALLVFLSLIAVCQLASGVSRGATSETGAAGHAEDAKTPDADGAVAEPEAPAKEPAVDEQPEASADAGDAEDAEDADAEDADADDAASALDPAIATAVETVLNDDDRGERKKAAKSLLSHEPESAVPSYALLAARLTDAKSCEGKREVLKEIAEAGDPRVLPALEKLSAIRRSGCKPRGKGDCFGCLRRTLASTIEGLAPDDAG